LITAVKATFFIPAVGLNIEVFHKDSICKMDRRTQMI